MKTEDDTPRGAPNIGTGYQVRTRFHFYLFWLNTRIYYLLPSISFHSHYDHQHPQSPHSSKERHGRIPQTTRRNQPLQGNSQARSVPPINPTQTQSRRSSAHTFPLTVNKVNEIRSNDSEPHQQNRLDTALADVFSLLSLFFLTIGRTKESPAIYSQIASMRVSKSLPSSAPPAPLVPSAPSPNARVGPLLRARAAYWACAYHSTCLRTSPKGLWASRLGRNSDPFIRRTRSATLSKPSNSKLYLKGVPHSNLG